MIYEYRCQSCGIVHEAERSVEKRQTVPCPKCGADPEKQQIQLSSAGMARQFTPTRRLTTEAEVIADRGPDWRQNAASLRRRAGEPDRLYMDRGGEGTTGAPLARKR